MNNTIAQSVEFRKGNAVQRCPIYYTKLVFGKSTLLIALSPNANIAPPAEQSTTLKSVEPRGMTIETIVKRSIPPPNEPHIASQVRLDNIL